MYILCFLENELIAPILLYGMVVIGSLSMVDDVSVVSGVFDQLFFNAEYHHSDSRHTFILTAI